MKNRLIITVSDVHGTRAFNIHQIAKKLIVAVVLIVAIILGTSFWFISQLDKQVDSLKKQKQFIIKEKEKAIKDKNQELREKSQEISILTRKEKKLQAQNQFYSVQIKSKVEDIEVLSSKLDKMEDMLGLKNDEKKEEITKETLKSINENMKMYMLKTIPSGFPLKDTVITSGHGYRIHPITKKRKFHRGIDFRAKKRTPVYSTADGIVTYVQSRNIGSFGRVIRIQHNFGFETTYAHLNKTMVKLGDIIRKNEKIGLSGNSGRSSAPHLHYEIRYGGKVLNPKTFAKWGFNNYNSIFTKERRVHWESLVKLINEQHKMVQQ